MRCWIINSSFGLGLLSEISLRKERIVWISPPVESLAACLTSCAIEHVHFRKLFDKLVVRQQ